MEVTTTVAAHDLQLAVNSLDDVGGGERTANVFRIVEKSQVVQALLTKFGTVVWQGRVGDHSPYADSALR